MLTQAHLDALVEAWASGALRVSYGDGREVQFRSRVELEAQISRVAIALGVANPLKAAGVTSARQYRMSTGKGV